MKAKLAELVLSLGVLGFGIALAIGTAGLSSAGGYARIGPNAAPAVVAVGLILLGIWLGYEALSGGWRDAPPGDPHARGEHPFHAGAFLWISAGLLSEVLLIHTAGFVLAQAVLFASVARGFGSAKLLRDVAAGLTLAIAVFLFFVKFLNVNLPAGWLWPLLGAAGI
jgi:putative tricarboxylic transport membrane protein